MSSQDFVSLEMIERFISFDTTSRDSNLPLIHFVRDFLGELGVESILTHDEEGRKANLFATIGPTDRPGIVLSGHTDVVPVDGQDWTTDPFKLTERDGKLYGRGVVDMKGFLAIATAFAPTLAKRELKTPIHLAMSYDEEVGCLGVHKMLDDLAAKSLQPIACIVGEPSDMNVVRAHKGKIGQHVEVRGLEAHTGCCPYWRQCGDGGGRSDRLPTAHRPAPAHRGALRSRFSRSALHDDPMLHGERWHRGEHRGGRMLL